MEGGEEETAAGFETRLGLRERDTERETETEKDELRGSRDMRTFSAGAASRTDGGRADLAGSLLCTMQTSKTGSEERGVCRPKIVFLWWVMDTEQARRVQGLNPAGTALAECSYTMPRC